MAKTVSSNLVDKTKILLRNRKLTLSNGKAVKVTLKDVEELPTDLKETRPKFGFET